MKKIEILLLGAVLAAGLFLRLYRFDNPVADWHSWRQADTSSVSRVFVEEGYDILHPRYHDLSNVPSGRDNPQGYRFVEFPVYNLAQAGLFSIFGVFSLEQWGRLVSIFASLSCVVVIYFLVKRHSGILAAFFAASFMAFIPFNIYFGRTILPDPSMAASIAAGVFFFDLWIGGKNPSKRLSGLYFILAVFFTALALLIKPFAVFFTLPMIVLAFQRFGFSFVLKRQLWLFLLISTAPLLAWRFWIMQFPEGVPASSWLLNGNGIRFKGAFFYWIFADRIGRLILGYWGIALLAFGLVANKLDKKGWFFLSFILSSLLYLTVVATGNVQHDYYQIPIIFSLAIFMGLGANFLIKAPGEYISKPISICVLTATVLFSLGFGWYFIRDYFNINNPAIIAAGEAVDRITPKDAKVIALYNGDTSFLYQTKRKGWASLTYDLPKMIELGADYLVIPSVSPGDLAFSGDYKILEQTSQYVIYDLHQKP